MIPLYILLSVAGWYAIGLTLCLLIGFVDWCVDNDPLVIEYSDLKFAWCGPFVIGVVFLVLQETVANHLRGKTFVILKARRREGGAPSGPTLTT